MPDIEWIRKLCLSFPDVTEDMPWVDDLCFKVRGKIFTGMVLSDGRFPRLTLKCAPETFHELLEIEGARDMGPDGTTQAVLTGHDAG